MFECLINKQNNSFNLRILDIVFPVSFSVVIAFTRNSLIHSYVENIEFKKNRNIKNVQLFIKKNYYLKKMNDFLNPRLY